MGRSIRGMMTSTCVDSTVRAASDRGFEAVLVGDACAAPGLEYDGVRVDADAVNAAFLAAPARTSPSSSTRTR